jgi:hypothetical protein
VADTKRGVLMPPDDPLVPANFGGWCTRVVGVIYRSFIPLVILQVGSFVVIGLIVEALGVLVAQQASGVIVEAVFWIGWLLGLMLGAWAWAASVFVAIRAAAGQPIGVGAALMFAAGKALLLAGESIGAALLTLVGLVLLIVPGIYLIIVFSATLTGVVVVEGGSLKRCFQLVNQRFWRTTGRMLFAFLISISYWGAIGVIINAAGLSPAAATAVQFIAAIPPGVATVAVAVVTYAELRFHDNPGTLTPTLAVELR